MGDVTLNFLKQSALSASFDITIFEDYASFDAEYSLPDSFGKDAELLLPTPLGAIINELTVSSGKEEFSSRAVNIRELNAAPRKNAIAAFQSGEGALTLRLMAVSGEATVRLSGCFSLERHGRHAALILCGAGTRDKTCVAEVSITIHGSSVSKAASPTHGVTTSTLDDDYLVLCRYNALGESFVLDIFYDKVLENHLVISRRVFQKNIALCRFIPQLPCASESAKTKFDLHLAAVSKSNQLEVRSAAIAFLRCLREEHSFRLSISGTEMLDYLPATEENIDRAINLICETEIAGGDIRPSEGDRNTVIICGGEYFCPGIDFSQEKPFVILAGSAAYLAAWGKIAHCAVVSGSDSEVVISEKFALLYEPRISHATAKPIGGLGVELLPAEFDILVRNSVNYCFALHQTIPPNGLEIFDKSGAKAEVVRFSESESHQEIRAINVMCSLELIKFLLKRLESAPPEEFCIYRDTINDICMKNKIAFGDIALSWVSDGEFSGIISSDDEEMPEQSNHLREIGPSDIPEILNRILKSQTSDGVIADITVSDRETLVFSTAVCLIALHLCEKKKYFAFARRSLDYLKKSGGFWAKAACDLWGDKGFDLAAVKEKLTSRAANGRVDKLAAYIILNSEVVK